VFQIGIAPQARYLFKHALVQDSNSHFESCFFVDSEQDSGGNPGGGEDAE
jgi:hypothetical protein